MKRLLLVSVWVMLIFGCEDTNVVMMTGAAVDAVNAITLSDEQVEQIAARAAVASDEKNKIAPASSPYAQRLEKLVKNYRTYDGDQFNYKVYLTDQVNAFAMADGTIRVYSGLMDLMDDEELMFVIGHEMGHVVHEHSRKKVVLAYASSALRKGLASQQGDIGDIAASAIGGFVEQLTHAQFSQYEERQADIYGYRFLRDQGYNTDGAVRSLNKLAELARNHTFLSSHPDPEKRAAIMLEKGDQEDEPEAKAEGSLLETLFGLVKKAISLVIALLNWVLSLF